MRCRPKVIFVKDLCAETTIPFGAVELRDTCNRLCRTPVANINRMILHFSTTVHLVKENELKAGFHCRKILRTELRFISAQWENTISEFYAISVEITD